MNPDTNKFEKLEESESEFKKLWDAKLKNGITQFNKELEKDQYHQNLLRQNGEPVPKH